MKFAEHLAAHITPEWRKQYIQYEVGPRRRLGPPPPCRLAGSGAGEGLGARDASVCVCACEAGPGPPRLLGAGWSVPGKRRPRCRGALRRTQRGCEAAPLPAAVSGGRQLPAAFLGGRTLPKRRVYPSGREVTALAGPQGSGPLGGKALGGQLIN